ncbi:MAG: GNAT family N-acetyltransferase [Moraxellaceae bacterium]|nr:GNAT family N-acetyltransferase [Pseudomonadales bacterium]MCP5174905.1 GNAT family N-acetyltransferase [Moraxellaceae bacterium]
MAISAPEKLQAHHLIDDFDCDLAPLNIWLKKRALSNQQRGFSVVMVVHQDYQVVGYYSIAPTAIIAHQLPRHIRTGQPPNPVPCLLLGQLATDKNFKGQGIGLGLLRHALERCVQGAYLIGGRAVVVHAINPQAADFWLKQDFIPSTDNPLTLLRPIQDIAFSLGLATP